MPIYLLVNQYILLHIVNRARIIIYEIILNPNSKRFLSRNIIANQK